MDRLVTFVASGLNGHHLATGLVITAGLFLLGSHLQKGRAAS